MYFKSLMLVESKKFIYLTWSRLTQNYLSQPTGIWNVIKSVSVTDAVVRGKVRNPMKFSAWHPIKAILVLAASDAHQEINTHPPTETDKWDSQKHNSLLIGILFPPGIMIHDCKRVHNKDNAKERFKRIIQKDRTVQKTNV